MTTHISTEVLAKCKQFIADITPPGEGITGNPLVNQQLAGLFGEGGKDLEVTLKEITFDAPPTPRFKMVGEEKNIANATGKFQLRGRAIIVCEGIESPIMLHAHTAAAFAKSDKVLCHGRTGQITNGANKDKFWLSLKPSAGFPNESEVLAFLESAATKPAVKL